jgi:two-component system, cell cycle sensor histidine kinase and response regulator CckA
METLQVFEERYGRLFESTNDGILILDAETSKVVDANPFFLRLVGYSSAELFGQYFRDLGVFGTIETSQGTFKTLQDHANFSYENLQLHTREGKSIFVELVSMMYTIGYTRLIQCNIHDVTERRQFEEALCASEDRFRTLYENSLIGLYRTTPEGKILLANPALVKMLGYSSFDELAGRDLEKEGFEPSYERRQFIEQIEATGEIKDLESAWTRRDGSVLYISENARAIRDANGKTLYYDGTIIDISKRKQFEDALRESEARYHGLFANMSEGFVLCEMIYDETGAPYDFRHLEVNQAFEKQTGLDADQIVGKTARELFPDIESSWAEMFSRVVLTGQPVRFENYSPGTGRYYEQFAYSMGKDRFAILATDITERKTHEQLLRDVQRREAIGVLSGGIAHDFNNLLGVMMGYISLAKAQLRADHPAFRHMENAGLAVARATELTKQILAYSGGGKTQIETIDLREEIQNHVSLFNISIPKNIMFDTDVPPDPVYVCGDPGQIKQIIMNLISNGADAIGEKQGIVSIKLSEAALRKDDLEHYSRITNTVLKEGRYALLEVSDNGGGMSREIIANIFDPFFTTKFTGRGLGLSAVLGILRSHEGGIAIESIEGAGTTFRIIIPVCAPSAARKVLALEDRRPDVIRVKATVLVIDDEESITKMAREILESGHYTVLTELNPVLGITLYKMHQSEIGAVLLDMTMPEMSGKEVTDALKALNPNVKIIISSGYSQQDIKNRIDISEVSGFIQKPYSLHSLLALVQSVLE